jgi:D-alanine-D-alanine ligase
MRLAHRAANGFLRLRAPENLRILFIAPYAPDGPGYAQHAYTEDGTYPEYHYEIYKRLGRLGFQVESASKPYAVSQASGAVDFVFSLFNRFPIRNPEVFVSAVCEYFDIPYLGAPPNVRAVAEDKYVSKLVAHSLGIPVPKGTVYYRHLTPLKKPPFSGPYFIKDRFGAGSEGITSENMQSDWRDARAVVETIWDRGTDAMIEEFIPGIDLTVPVVGDTMPRTLGLFHPLSDKEGSILTEELKLTDHLGYRIIESSDVSPLIAADIGGLCQALGPIDYFRIDYRFDPVTGERRMLELNVCCYIGEAGPFGIGAEKIVKSADDLLAHIVAFSVARQSRQRHHRHRIL